VTHDDLTRLFWHAMRAPQVDGDELVATFRGDDRLGAVDRVGIYRGMYWARQIEALGEDFPRLRAALGEQAFAATARAYLERHPSRAPRIEELGRDLAGFLAEDPEVSRRPLAALAAFEWAGSEALLAPDPPAVIHALGGEAGGIGALCLRFVPALRLLDLPEDPLVEPPRARGRFAIWRQGFHVHHRALDDDELGAALDAQAGAPLAAVCARFDGAPDPALRAASVLRRWLRDGWIAAACPPPSTTEPRS
jgi:hypothetical protein